MTDFSLSTIKARLVQFETTDRLLLPGLLFEPKTKTKKIALVLHGSGSSSIFYSVNKAKIFAEMLTKKGIAFFPFNNRGAHYIKWLYQINQHQEKEELKIGTTYEQIKDCLYDIDGAINYLKTLGYTEFYLIGYSTGANKICVYNYYQPRNTVKKYILLGGGDDTGLYYQMIGKRTKFFQYLKTAKIMLERGLGEKIVPKYMVPYLFSYQSFYDVCNPDGDYNIFPFNEALNNLKLAKKELFREYKSINKPTLVIYGEQDEYCYGDVPKVVELLKTQTQAKKNFIYKIIKKATHGFSEHSQELAALVTSWLC